MAADLSYHHMGVEVRETKADLTIILLKPDGSPMRTTKLTGIVRERFMNDFMAASEDTARSMVWALFGYSRKMLNRPIARTICHPGKMRG